MEKINKPISGLPSDSMFRNTGIGSIPFISGSHQEEATQSNLLGGLYTGICFS
jgi:hypothetical protein